MPGLETGDEVSHFRKDLVEKVTAGGWPCAEGSQQKAEGENQ